MFHYNTAGVVHYNIAAPQTLTPGKRTLVFDFKYDGGGVGKRARDTPGGRRPGSPRTNRKDDTDSVLA